MQRSIAIVAYDDVQLLDVAGRLEVFELARRRSLERDRPDPYTIEVLGPLTGR